MAAGMWQAGFCVPLKPLLRSRVMYLFVMAALYAHLTVIPRSELLAQPTDVSAAAQGVAAAAFDPAAAGRLDGAELQLRQMGLANQQGTGAWSVYGAVPVGRLRLFGGYAWRPLPNPTSQRGTYGLAWALTPGLQVGVGLQRLQVFGRAVTHSVWDAGVAGMPTSWLSWSLGVDAFNAPDYGRHIALPRSLRAGVAVRPWHGNPQFTLAADTRLQQANGWHLPDSRMLVDVGLVPGVHVVGAYGRRLGHNEVYAGVRLALFNFALQTTAAVDNATQARGIDRLAWQLTLRQRAAESLLPPVQRQVEVPLQGDLMPAPAGLFSPGAAMPTVALQLRALARDPAVATVVLPIADLHVGMATVEELRQAIFALRQAGKTVIAELHGAQNKDYLVATAANRIHMDPLGHINLKGFSIASHFFAQFLRKVGVRFDAVAVGRYKSAPDALTADAPRQEDREVFGTIVQAADAALGDSLQRDRGCSQAAVEHALAVGLMGAADAQRAGLVDALVPSADLAHTADAVPDVRQTFAQSRTPSPVWGAPPEIAIVPVVGTIVAQPGRGPLPATAADADRVVGLLEAAVADARVAGIVVRVDSPGGDVFASETMWRAMHRAAEAKPVAVSMGDVAASGGYYMALPAGVIFAEPQTLTGSIGIFMLKPDVSGLLQWAGVHREVYGTAAHADWESMAHSISDADRGRLQAHLESLYTAFVDRVAAGRGLPPARVREIAEGHVYTGAQAQALGLVDRLGGLADAVAWVQEQAGLAPTADVSLRVPNRTVGLPQRLGQMAHAAVATSSDGDPLDSALRALQQRVHAVDAVPLALMPWSVQVGADD
jgi:protease-4